MSEEMKETLAICFFIECPKFKNQYTRKARKGLRVYPNASQNIWVPFQAKPANPFFDPPHFNLRFLKRKWLYDMQELSPIETREGLYHRNSRTDMRVELEHPAEERGCFLAYFRQQVLELLVMVVLANSVQVFLHSLLGDARLHS